MEDEEISITVEGETPSTSYPEVSGLPSEYKQVLKEEGEMEALVKFKRKPDGKICIEEINGEPVGYEKEEVSEKGYMKEFYNEGDGE